MGVDLPDVRTVVHLQAPGSPEAYYQEAGRAGRDGKASRCVLFFGEDDIRIQQHLSGSNEALQALEHYARVDTVCRQQTLCEYLEGGPGTDACGRCDVCRPALRRAPAPRRRKALTKADRALVIRVLKRLDRPVALDALSRALRGWEVKRLSKADLLTLPELGALERHDDTAVRAAVDELVTEGRLRRRMAPRGPMVMLASADDSAPQYRERTLPPPTAGATSIAPELDRACRAKARELAVRPSALLPRRAIVGIDRARPETLDELRRVPGVRESTVEAMGEELLALVERYAVSRARR
jgi:ATP-dependent DNA helicase RecQ